jgi:hypothetical protein
VFAVLALQTVLPRDLAEVPVERIIEARRRLLPQLMNYREYLDSLTPDFVAISHCGTIPELNMSRSSAPVRPGTRPSPRSTSQETGARPEKRG